MGKVDWFPNLSRRSNPDRVIERELTGAGIRVARHDQVLYGDVKTSLSGYLPEKGFPVLAFRRSWNYWRVEGQIPFRVACVLHRLRRDDIRVYGLKNCPDLELVATYYDHKGNTLVRPGVLSTLPVLSVKDEDQQVFFVDKPEQVATRATVDLYHIHSQEGLMVFVETLRKYGEID